MVLKVPKTVYVRSMRASCRRGPFMQWASQKLLSTPKPEPPEVFTSILLPKPVAPERLPIYYGPRPKHWRPKQREKQTQFEAKGRAAPPPKPKRRGSKPALESQGGVPGEAVPEWPSFDSLLEAVSWSKGEDACTPEWAEVSGIIERCGMERQEQELKRVRWLLLEAPHRSLCPPLVSIQNPGSCLRPLSTV